MEDKKIVECATEYLTTNTTISEVADNNDVDKRTLQLNLKKLENINPKLFKMVEKKKIENQVAGRVKGGKIGKRERTYSKEEINEIADKFISKQMTYKEGEEIEGIASSTLHDILHSDLVDEDKKLKLAVVAKANKMGTITEEMDKKGNVRK